MSVRIAGQHHHPSGDFRSPKAPQSESAFKNRKGFAWLILTILFISMIGLVVISMVDNGDDDNTDDQQQTVEDSQ